MQRGHENSFNEWLSMFASAPGVGVALVSSELRVLYANATAARLYSSLSPDELRGKSLADVMPQPWMEQREPVIRRVLETGRPVIVRAIMRGRQIESTILPVPGDDGEGGKALLVSIEGQTPPNLVPEGVEVVESDVVDLGPLAVLTPRELEVLSLIGQGQSAKEIAAILNCSPRTVERHRDSIGKKLDKDDRVKLAIVARAAGLELHDAQLNRISLPPAQGAEGSIQEVKPRARERSRTSGGHGTSNGS